MANDLKDLSEDVERLKVLLRKQQSHEDAALNEEHVRHLLETLDSPLFSDVQKAYAEVAKTMESSGDVKADADETAQKTVAVYNASQGYLQPRVVDIPKVPAGLGFNIMGGNDINVPIYISKILPGGVTEKTGGLRRGDQLLAVDGQSVQGKSHENVVKLLRDAEGSVRLIVNYSPELLEQMENEFESSRRKSNRRTASSSSSLK